MSEDSKIQKAREITSITEAARRKSGNDSASVGDEVRQKLQAAQTEISVELFAKHMSEEQLDAMLEFYRSEIGESIMIAQQAISGEYQQILRQKLAELSKELQSGRSGE